MENTTTQDEGKWWCTGLQLFIKEKRLVLGMTQGDLADKVLDPKQKGYISQIESEKRKDLYKCSR
jgi:transcriptional regulator with XRE-family HTH domain